MPSAASRVPSSAASRVPSSVATQASAAKPTLFRHLSRLDKRPPHLFNTSVRSPNRWPTDLLPMQDQVEVEEGEKGDIPVAGAKGGKCEDLKDEDRRHRRARRARNRRRKGHQGQGEGAVRNARVFVPSQDKIAVRATWWGYTLYFPPPILIATIST
ncbi:hypothetical protein CALCODRAFT_488913 [Calocera cornea HHB12733]|uniref:Uncharacterized protein n=1 Tax=Calocera cornea HHB12733 TaxID=1353952 RepID=A0A165C2Q1_9BASI|nr:hypothetical protein CALCODRAFT_488913 [Calocera cornea HHB12733]